MVSPTHVANQLLKLELQLRAYQKLHADELAELWKALDECKHKIAGFNDEGETARLSEEIIPSQIESAEEDL